MVIAGVISFHQHKQWVMSVKINTNYLENYSQQVAEKICTGYFGTKQYLYGQEIINLTPSTQLNLMLIKTLFAAWQEELEKLKGNPYFDYQDDAVNEALKEFMNVLSRAIKIEGPHFEPLMKKAVQASILLAADPVKYFTQEINKTKPEQMHHHLKASRKYLKWHSRILEILIEKAGSGASPGELKRALEAHFDYLKEQLETPESLLAPLNQVLSINYNELFIPEQAADRPKEIPEGPFRDEKVKPDQPVFGFSDHSPQAPAEGGKAIDPALAWARFESEEYGFMKGSLGELAQSVGINQRVMFTKVLFEGKPELMMEALKSIDRSESFIDAIEMLNQRFVAALNWDLDSEEVNELLQLVFRKFDQKA